MFQLNCFGSLSLVGFHNGLALVVVNYAANRLRFRNRKPFNQLTQKLSSFIVSVDPKFSGPIQNATVAVGRDAVLTCMVEDLGAYKVSFKLIAKQRAYLLSLPAELTQRLKATHGNSSKFISRNHSLHPHSSGHSKWYYKFRIEFTTNEMHCARPQPYRTVSHLVEKQNCLIFLRFKNNIRLQALLSSVKSLNSLQRSPAKRFIQNSPSFMRFTWYRLHIAPNYSYRVARF